MALTKELKVRTAEEFGKGAKDGSLSVQIAIFHERIKELAGKRDRSSAARRLVMMRTRKELVRRYKRCDADACVALCAKLGL